MKKWRSSITTTIVLTVVFAVVLGVSIQNVVSSGLVYLGLARQQTFDSQNPRLLRQLPGRIAALVDVVQASPDEARPAILKAAQRPLLQVRLLDAPLPNLINQREPEIDLLRTRIQAMLSTPRPVVVAHPPNRPGQVSAGGEDHHDNRVLIEAALSDGHWLLFISGMQLPSPVDPVAARFAQTSLAAWLAAAILLGILVSILVARRLVKPLSTLAEVVERAGVTGTAMAMPASGPLEIQAIIEAFNRMQGRLSRFIEDRTRMIAAISHDLRTPLTRLQLRMESPDVLAERQRMLADLHAMGEMINSVISFAQEDTRREPRLLVDIATLVEGICDDAADAGQSVTFSGARGVAISCRPIALRRAISNLVDNAIKYGTNATVHLAQEPERVVITIDDDGPGIPPSQRDKVFEPFYRQERSRNPETGGVGLGLSVARSIIWEHSGDIRLANRREGGLHVRVDLPGPEQQIPTDTERAERGLQH